MIISVIWCAFCVIAIVYSIKLLWQRRRLYALSWSLHGPVSLPIIGHGYLLPRKSEDFLDILASLFQKYPSPISFWQGPKLVVAFTDVHHIEKIMTSMKFARKDSSYRFLQPLLGNGLISGSGPKWKAHRRVLVPLFAPKLMEKCLPIIVKHSERLIQLFNNAVDQPAFDVDIHLHRCVTDIVNESFMGIESNAQNGAMEKFLQTMLQLYDSIYARIVHIWLQNDFLYNLLGFGKIDKRNVELIHSYFRKCLKEAQNKHSQKSPYLNDTDQFQSVLERILKITGFETDDDILYHLTTFYQASEDTITQITTFALVLLGMYPNIQSKVYKELQDVFGSKPRAVELNDLPKLHYLDMCVKDVLRLFPIAPFIMREVSEDTQIDKWRVLKGCSVIIPIYVIHRSPEHWEQPNDFHPEHFLPENVKRRHSLAFMPFSAGPRGCIGKPFAMMAILTILATTLRNYQVEADGTLQEKKLKADISVRFKDDMYLIRLKKRIP